MFNAVFMFINFVKYINSHKRIINQYSMNKIFKGLIAGYGAKKLGGGCFGTIIVFIIIWWLLGYF